MGKEYRLGATVGSYGRLTESLSHAFRGGVGRREIAPASAVRESSRNTIWALRDVEFEVDAGDVIGIIGRNGAGKTTLLKVLSRITAPTRGRIEMNGRVGVLLEVGTGFHPELTGRENIFLNGAILGMDRAQIRRRFDEILAFAEVEKFIDTPVKRYSSGMYVRLAFSVAAHLEPEILIIDEVLAVGDVAFQRKSLGKMHDVSHEGRTVLFVSHNMAAVQNLCNSAIVLEAGRVAFEGTQNDAITYYLRSATPTGGFLADRADRKGSGAVRVTAMEIRDVNGVPLDAVTAGQSFDLFLYFERRSADPVNDATASVLVKSEFDVPMFLQHSRLAQQRFGPLPERGAFVCRFEDFPLNAGTYRVAFDLSSAGTILDAIGDAFELLVISGDFFGASELPPPSHGPLLVRASWRLDDIAK